jgi:hypothetical protein
MEIVEAKGDAVVWQGQLAIAGREEALIAQFEDQAAEIYAGILKELDNADADLSALGRRFQQAQAQDYFASEQGVRVREELLRREAQNH